MIHFIYIIVFFAIILIIIVIIIVSSSSIYIIIIRGAFLGLFSLCFFLVFLLINICIFQHMIKYRYLPFTYGKQKYRGKDDSGDVTKS